MCATSGCIRFLVPVITDVDFFFLFLLVGLISHQPIEVNVKPVLFYRTAGTLLSCLACSKHAVALICEPELSGL